MIYSPGERIGDFEVIQHKTRGKWLWRCVHCTKEKMTTFTMMKRTGMKRCSCQTLTSKRRHYPGDTVGDFIAVRHKRSGQWLFRCAHCRAEKTTSFHTMQNTGMKHCACQKPKPLLTPAQQRVQDLFAKGYSNRDMAALLGISHVTVSAHLRGIYERRLQGNA